MAQYMLQFSYTSEAWAALGRRPTDRSRPLAALASKLGAKLISLNYTMGEFDGVAVVEARDDKSAMALIIAVLAPGHIRATKTTRLYTPKEMVAALKKSAGAGYSAPKG
jgi:uncharacterized protein with GYD domain